MGEHVTPATSPEQRFTVLFMDHYNAILAFARRRVEQDLAQDVVAETFLTAWRHMGDLPDEPLPWLYRVASHAIANQQRGATRRHRLHDRARLLGEQGYAEDHAEAVSERERLASAFESLSERDQEVLRLAIWERLDRTTAASVLGCSPAAFKVRLHRARRRLERSLAQEGGEPRRNSSRAVTLPWKEIL
jgi:RNA polymerase sigma-70 factor (ECF subfamily)